MEACTKQEVIKTIQNYQNIISKIKKSINSELKLIDFNNQKQVKHFKRFKNNRLKTIKYYENLILLNKNYNKLD